MAVAASVSHPRVEKNAQYFDVNVERLPRKYPLVTVEAPAFLSSKNQNSPPHHKFIN